MWYYAPSVHKTEHLDREKCVVLGPRAMAVLAPFLTATPKRTASTLLKQSDSGVTKEPGNTAARLLRSSVRWPCEGPGRRPGPTGPRPGRGQRVLRHPGPAAAPGGRLGPATPWPPTAGSCLPPAVRRRPEPGRAGRRAGPRGDALRPGPPARRGGRDPATWNVACDLAVNPLLIARRVHVCPRCRLMPGEGTYADLAPGKSAEEYYALLGRPAGHPRRASRRPGDRARRRRPRRVRRGDRPGRRSTRPTSRQLRGRVDRWPSPRPSRRRTAAASCPPGSAARSTTVLHPPADWRSVLREFVSAHARNDYSWARPNRRFLAQGLYLPGLHSEELGDVVLAVDTSGSVGDRRAGRVRRRTEGLLAAFDCTVTVLYHDTDGAEGPDLAVGRRAARPRPGRRRRDATSASSTGSSSSGLTPACVVCLTDLETAFPDQSAGRPGPLGGRRFYAAAPPVWPPRVNRFLIPGSIPGSFALVEVTVRTIASRWTSSC